VSRREFWDTLAHLSAGGLTILVGTPYLGEAERCPRVALMDDGELRGMGKPIELKRSFNAKRLEIRTSQLGEMERIPGDISGPEKNIIDVQRFGDRLDLLVRDPDEAKRTLNERMADGLHLDELRIDEPTLENTFVATLRRLGHQAHELPFPGRHDHRKLRGQIAVSATNLTKQFGSFTAVRNV